ncbi:MAG: 7-cyano-7-deazaguanine synthase QueC [bacterium]|nr:7-cyano-7-deazaguanine synthase QueC [bacterium]
MAIVLLSGGLDSTVSLAKSVRKIGIKLALTFDYGQKANQKEIHAASLIARHYKIPHQVIKLPWLANITKTSLVNKEKAIPKFSFKESNYKETAEAVWVPNRNGVFINISASFAEALGYKYIICGFNKEEGETFPDNSIDFLKSINKALNYSTLSKVKVLSFVIGLNKKGIAKEGLKYRIPFEFLWSCYDGQEEICGKCESCQRTTKVFRKLKIL